MRNPLLAAPDAAMLLLAATPSLLIQIVALTSLRSSRYADVPLGLAVVPAQRERDQVAHDAALPVAWTAM